MKIDLDYYARIANGNEFDPIILRSELNDLVKEVRIFLSKTPPEPAVETDTKQRCCCANNSGSSKYCEACGLLT